MNGFFVIIVFFFLFFEKVDIFVMIKYGMDVLREVILFFNLG